MMKARTCEVGTKLGTEIVHETMCRALRKGKELGVCDTITPQKETQRNKFTCTKKLTNEPSTRGFLLGEGGGHFTISFIHVDFLPRGRAVTRVMLGPN